MKLLHHFRIIIAILCLLSPCILYADTKFEQIERMWKAGKYEDVIPRLIDYSENVEHLGIRLLVDYMLGTSMCRVPGYQTDGEELLALIPYIYRHISRYNYDLILEEKCNCKINSHKVARLSYEPPGVAGKGGREMISSTALALSEKKFIDRIKEYNSRLYEIKKELPLDIEIRMKELAGSDYNVVVHGHFIVVGNHRKPELFQTGKMLEETLSLFLKQFKMDAPKYFTTVYLITTAEKMVRFARENHEIDIPPTMWGYTFAYDASIVIRASGGMGTVGHEIFHTLLNHNFPMSPPWLNEGFSALFEEFRGEDGRMVGTYRNNHWRIKYLYKVPEKRPSIAALIAMDWRKFDAPGTWQAKEMHINHTTAKFFAMYLQNRQERLEEVFHAFRNKDFRKGSGGIVSKYKNVLEEVLGNTPIEQIEKDFQRWLTSVEEPFESIINTGNTAQPDGNGRWNWTVFLDADQNTLSEIKCVEYTLHPTFPKPIRKVCNPANGFGLSSNGWGTFNIKIKIMFKDGRTRKLNHMLRFRQ